ncbi:biotin--[acetyl-CoA-carboxylase] ligase [Algoriphagus pacificus]|uniref:biotin--[biotin carboxyl-carrier protein] ligase n=1 Tax=Algoriphagus pacificus TaxID=2811234 RepID=A0ABS3CEG4_9BACT|nr:biotin--[acetyl-CoA-carboxylase] ligase [Algoriphagus pacificus]MBN7815417.1 biotin--[acetyl-CoA-carboxylase] ligase [Algoriphagus pacificus]
MYKILANTIFLGKDVHFLPDCHSTNDIALQMVRSGQVQEGAIVICGYQTKGKGQRGNSWVSEPGKNLTFSLVLKPAFLDITEQFVLNMCISNAIRKVLQDYVPYLTVKWPNDLVVPDFGKLGGILIENVISSKSWENAVVGIGLNINQLVFENEKATSLSKITGNNFDLQELFRLIITQIEQSYLQLKKGKHKEIKNDYLSHLYLKNQIASFRSENGDFSGQITGIDEQGKLLIEDETGELRTFGLKEVAFLD